MDELTLEESLEILKKEGITRSAQVLRRWLRDGKLEGEKIPGQRASWRIRKEKLEEFIRSYKPNVRKSIETGNIDVKELLNMREVIRIPLFQRNFVWDIEHQVMFIDTLLRWEDSLNPVSFFLEGSSYVLVDGRQRLETIYAFYENKFALNDIPEINGVNINGLKYKDLPDSLKESFLDASVSVIYLKNYSYEELAEQFLRFNLHTPLKLKKLKGD